MQGISIIAMDRSERREIKQAITNQQIPAISFLISPGYYIKNEIAIIGNGGYSLRMKAA